MELSPGHLLKNRYQIKEPLGQGGMGTVYLAEDTALDQLVAVKSNLNPGSEGAKQFEVEARLLAKLRHPNLPLVFDHFIIDDVQYLVMDYIPGENLNQRLKEEGPQAVYKVLEWAEQISGALNYLHRQDPPVIHRDIKPANIKITPEGKIVLVDFGIAKASSENTTVGARGYTPGYAPPEQYSDAVTGPYSDQYSFAATIYALLTGGPPPESVDLMLGQKTLAPTRMYSKNTPLHVDHALQRAMAIEPSKRFKNVDQFFTALTDPAAMADDTYLPGTDTILADGNQLPPLEPEPPAVPIWRSPWLWIGLVALLALLGGGGFLLTNLLRGGSPGDAAKFTPTLGQILVEENAEPDSDTAANLTPTETPQPSVTPEPMPTFTPAPEPTPFGGGSKIAFVSNRNTWYQIYVMDTDGSNVTQLTFDEIDKSWPMWSPDGTKILYVADGGPGPFGTRYGLDIWVMDADGSNQTNLTLERGADTDPVWSPDGSKIVFVSGRFGGTRQLMVMNADGSDQQRISSELEEYNPTFSPDGSTLLFSSTFFFTLNMRTFDPNDHPEDVDDLFDINLVPELYDNRYDEPDRIGKGDEPAWSPDGNWIVYIRTNGNNRRVYLLDANSNGATVRDLGVPGLSYDPAWSPDSMHIVFTNSTQGKLEIFTMDLGGRFQTNLTDHPADDKMPSWQPIP
jgi:serine/threonine protein kinase